MFTLANFADVAEACRCPSGTVRPRAWPTEAETQCRQGGNDISTAWRTPAAFAAANKDIWPFLSTVSIESPAWREIVLDAVDTTVLTPRHALSSDARSLRSPRTRVTPVRSSRAALSASAVARIRARTGCPAATSRRQISLPRVPVAPTTRFMLNASDARLSGSLDGRNVNQTRLRVE